MAARRASKRRGSGAATAEPRRAESLKRLARACRDESRYVDEGCLHRERGKHHEGKGKHSWAASAFRDAARAFRRAAEGNGQTRGMSRSQLLGFETEMLEVAERNSGRKK